MKKDMRELPKIRDSLTYLYVEHSKIEQEHYSISIKNTDGRTPVPIAALSLLLLGPGTSITHSAIRALAENGCLISWVGERGVRFYSQGIGETRSAQYLLKQAFLVSHPKLRLEVVKDMYRFRFNEDLDPDLTIQQLRGKEGARVRKIYKKLSEITGVKWKGRNYQIQDWNSSDPINKAISSANACLYGLCHAAIVSMGLSPGLGFIHTGKQLSFVYDIADLYKFETVIPAAFHTVQESKNNVASRVRKACRDLFYEEKILKRIIPDLKTLIDNNYPIEPMKNQEYEMGEMVIEELELDFDSLKGIPGALWDPVEGFVKGGNNYEENK